jgi:hypothetical protein
MDKSFFNKLINKDSEESYKSGWVNHFSKVYKKVGELPSVNTVSRIDHYTKKMLYEFKYKTYFNTKRAKAKVIAQALYYIHHIYVGRLDYQSVSIPPFIACISMYTGMIFETEMFYDFYTSEKYDWFIRACDASLANEGENLVDDLMQSSLVDKIKVYDFSNNIDEKAFIEYHHSIHFGNSKIVKGGITVDNIGYVYNLWKDKFAKIFLSKNKSTDNDEHYLRSIFLKDITDNGTTYDAVSKKVTVFEGDETISVQIGSYESFWQNYDKIDDMEKIEHIRQTADRLLDKDVRAMQGAFYTPPAVAERAMIYIEKMIGKIDWDSGKFRLYDPAGGHGNLICRLPNNVLKHCYISTFEQEGSDYNATAYKGVTAWQYDYVNDDISSVPCGKKKKLFNFNYNKMPKKFVEDLNNPEITWIILVNPPYGTSAAMKREVGKNSKDGITNGSLIHDWMIADGLSGKATQEFYCQFVYRICKEFEGKKAYLGMFSKITYLNSVNNMTLRDKTFRKEFLTGFGIRSKMFHGVKGDFLISFMLWNLNSDIHVSEQKIKIDLLDDNIEKCGTKIISTRSDLLNSAGVYFNRPDTTIDCLGYTGALNYSDGSTHSAKGRNMKSEDAIFFCRLAGNSLKEVSNSFISSRPCFGAGGFSVNEENVRKAMVAFGSLNAQNKNWTNDNDMLYIPNQEVSDEFANDCFVFSIVCNGNYSSSIASYPYKDELVRIQCQVFPFTHDEVSSWECHFDDIKADLLADTEDRFFAKRLNELELSREATLVIEALRNLYKYFFLHVHEGEWDKWETKNWDVGFYQVRNFVNGLHTDEGNELLRNLRNVTKTLKEKIRLETVKYDIVQ